MVTWLGDWLRDIIAVIMLAVFMELLLPNKAMQRYARLVIGLLILLTILSPILRLLQGDFSARLGDSVRQWEMGSGTQEIKMPTLQDIQKDAENLSKQRDNQAAALTQQTLEKAMAKAVGERTKAKVQQVDVELKWAVEGSRRTPYLNKVTVTLAAAEAAQSGKGDAGGDANRGGQVDEVQPVDVTVKVDAGAAEGSSGAGGASGGDTNVDADAEEAWVKVSPALGDKVRSVLADGWGVSPEIVLVRQPAAG
ncbi:stage III sporulation protein AF [Paenibacillus sp. NPDC058174]|uniref:stage III sporulation protein AF n=1 Tax=Paenibacillus sp. NPDC058174 TaxID=3346366 RepID=UPI0036D87BA1